MVWGGWVYGGGGDLGISRLNFGVVIVGYLRMCFCVLWKVVELWRIFNKWILRVILGIVIFLCL